MNRDEVATLRALLAPTGWPERARVFARALRTSTKTRGGLLLVGTPEEEPWHLAAHLDDESRLSGIAELAPTLVRWNAPLNAPPHLRIGLERLEAARRGETLFVVTPETAPSPLLERVSDARRVGATILALNQGDRELDGLAHETLTVGHRPWRHRPCRRAPPRRCRSPWPSTWSARPPGSASRIRGAACASGWRTCWTSSLARPSA